jgi:alkylation response protein AidB-like acyl-CoA dehydrogenase
MDFEFSQDQEMLRETVQRWVAKDYGFERRRKIVAEGGFSKTAWGEMAALGLTGLAVPEKHGGMGFGPVDAMVVMQELGRGLVLEPFAAVALTAAAILDAGHASSAAPWQEQISAGEALVVLAHQEFGARYCLAQVTTQARKVGQTWRLNGTKSLVPCGAQAGAFLVSARVSGAQGGTEGIGLFLVTANSEGVKTRAYQTQDGAAAAELFLADAIGIEQCPAGQAFAVLEHGVDIGIAALCAEAVGAMDQLFAITVDYMNTRKQFGVPIGTFQALRHRVADMKMQLELARSMSYFATLKLGDDAASRRRALSAAKVQIGQSMRYVGQQAVQLHGGIAVTDEYIASHYFKRLTCIEMTWGDTMHHLGEVSARMQETAGVFA